MFEFTGAMNDRIVIFVVCCRYFLARIGREEPDAVNESRF